MELAAWSEIDLDALKSNVRKTRHLVGKDVKILLTVKADAYGHGAPRIANTAISEGVDMLGVATLHEGIELRCYGIDVPILILSPSLISEIDEIIEWNLTPTVSDLKFAQALSFSASSRGPIRVHVEVDTGMTRAGVNEEDAYDFLRKISMISGITVEGIYTHFPSTYLEDADFTSSQVKRFEQLIDRLESDGLVFPLRHASNSAAVIQYPQSYFNMVRPGGMIYGMLPREEFNSIGLKPVMSLKSKVVNVKDVKAGRTVSYGRTFRFSRDSRLAAVAVGYGHGLSRRLSNSGYMLVRGRHAPIVGTVTMDITLIDVTDIPGVTVGDEVVIFGRQGEDEITVYQIAEWCETISYEVTCSIGKRVPRVYVENGQVKGIVTLVGERLPKEKTITG
ncbi:MAG: alanine racemase [bacterium]